MIWQLLLVEDEPSVREAFALRLSDQGYVVQTAGSGEEAFALLRSFEPDILILDLVMPNLSGLDVLARVKTNVAPSAGHPPDGERNGQGCRGGDQARRLRLGRQVHRHGGLAACASPGHRAPHAATPGPVAERAECGTV